MSGNVTLDAPLPCDAAIKRRAEPEGYTIWRSAATGWPWWRAVKIGETTTFEQAARDALRLSAMHGEVRVLPTGKTPAARDAPNAQAAAAWIVANNGTSLCLHHGPSAARLLARACGEDH